MGGQDRRVTIAVLATCAAAMLGLLAILAWSIDRHAAGWWRGLAASATRAGVPADIGRSDRRPVPPAADPARAGAKVRGNPGQFFDSDAYPAAALREGAEGRTVAQLAIDASGVPVGCTVVTSSGWRSLDAATCAIAIGRVRYTPARDAAGRPIAATARLPVRWVLPR